MPYPHDEPPWTPQHTRALFRLFQTSAPPDFQRQILEPRGFRVSGLTEREVRVLRLVADGHNTAEIASQLSYSERTIKNVIQDVITRFQLRNRSHAVAYAVRQGFI